MDERSQELIEQLAELDDGEGVAIGALEEVTDHHRRTLLRALNELIDQGLVRREGAGRGTRYLLERPVEEDAPTAGEAEEAQREVGEEPDEPREPRESRPWAPTEAERQDWECRFIAQTLRDLGRWVTPAEVYRRGELLPLDELLVRNLRQAISASEEEVDEEGVLEILSQGLLGDVEELLGPVLAAGQALRVGEVPPGFTPPRIRLDGAQARPDEANEGLHPLALEKIRASGMDFDEARRLVSLLSKNPELREKLHAKMLTSS